MLDICQHANGALAWMLVESAPRAAVHILATQVSFILQRHEKTRRNQLATGSLILKLAVLLPRASFDRNEIVRLNQFRTAAVVCRADVGRSIRTIVRARVMVIWSARRAMMALTSTIIIAVIPIISISA
ncbi:hypothetical protein D3C80_411240 [compost metagenome]